MKALSEVDPLLIGADCIREVVAAQKRGQPLGIYSVCSAHPQVLEAAARFSVRMGLPLLVESTCNQVNQYGGYTGMTPRHFVGFVRNIAGRFNLPSDHLILGGDHLGPGPWQNEPAAGAMDKAQQMVREYVLAGYTKIHLDASMRCADDAGISLNKTQVAERVAVLAQVAETAYRELPVGSPSLVYVVGTEVPVAGGMQVSEGVLQVSRSEDVQEDMEMTRRAFIRHGLEGAWERTMALVVQPGVEFGDGGIHSYDRGRAAHLTRLIETVENLVYEAHSTDYQTAQALQHLVEDHFAILKVGPALTYAFREAVFALEWMEKEWLGRRPQVQLSDLQEALDQVMLGEPGAWQNYYRGDEFATRFARRYSYSDRSRYYWTHPRVQRALQRLLANLDAQLVPPTLLSQFMPVQYERLRGGQLANTPLQLVYDKIETVLAVYAEACGLDS